MNTHVLKTQIMSSERIPSILTKPLQSLVLPKNFKINAFVNEYIKESNILLGREASNDDSLQSLRIQHVIFGGCASPSLFSLEAARIVLSDEFEKKGCDSDEYIAVLKYAYEYMAPYLDAIRIHSPLRTQRIQEEWPEGIVKGLSTNKFWDVILYLANNKKLADVPEDSKVTVILDEEKGICISVMLQSPPDIDQRLCKVIDPMNSEYVQKPGQHHSFVALCADYLVLDERVMPKVN